ncbi:MAG: 2'-5' RNA ligase [Candidatus Wolfebacteria bacterium GW2011_GWC2_39_22]|uniref:RNA 2',3'-cyclic phosphodiesterase n=1 Tax=Candidatus Wolfebacteria bacterium GW2011_GWC2_39_22 TaxID=1619013 RepID=A0A0G0NJ97_9BACT|nr:MAG: 2'-5' RNA ligase [Candidatus Wolfebacteria bacterium GW2011_GWC2_39_22]HBI25428.1 RNA 2',3'-cyclic phosphodiesterase [Candidatus Wolfebacteria bacterium]
MEHKLFIAINLPQDIKTTIRNAVDLDKKNVAELYTDAHPIPENNWHLTIKFLGNQPEEALSVIEDVLHTVVTKISTPVVSLRTLTTAPPKRPPRMVWITTITPTNEALGQLKHMIEQGLAAKGIFQKGEAHPAYHGHINIANLPEGRKIEGHVTTFPSTLTFTPATIDLMESRLDSTGATYSIVKSIDFKPSV